MVDENGIAEIFDTREDGLRCVRFVSGEVGVVDVHGKVILQYRQFRHVEFAAHDFVKLRSSKEKVMLQMMPSEPLVGDPVAVVREKSEEEYFRLTIIRKLIKLCKFLIADC